MESTDNLTQEKPTVNAGETRLNAGNAGECIVRSTGEGKYNFIFLDARVNVRCHSLNHLSNSVNLSFCNETDTIILHSVKLRLDDFSQRDRLVKSLISKQAAVGDVVYWDDILHTIVLYFERLQGNLKPSAFTTADILSADVTERTWLCKDFLPSQGISILAGKPKRGKSIMALRISHAIATGGKFLDRQCDEGKVCYLALEDNVRRLKSRYSIMGITTDVPITVYFSIAPLPNGLPQLKELLAGDNYSLVVLDTVLSGMVPGIKENDAIFGQSIESLHSLANELGLTMLLIHHFTKRPSGDVLTDLRGHGSAGGAVDLALGLYDDEQPGHFTLKSISRDSDRLEIDLAFSGDEMLWTLDTSYNEVQRIRTDTDMLELLTDLGEVTVDEVSNANQKSRQANDAVLKRLILSGHVKRTPAKKNFATVYIYKLGGKGIAGVT